MNLTPLATRLSLFVLLSFPTSLLLAQEPTPAKPAEPPKAEQASAQKPAEQPKTLQLGSRVNGATLLTDIDGKPQKAAELMGKITVVNFYSIQCPIQAAWDKRLATIQKDFEKDGVVFLHIDSNKTEIGEAPPKVEGDAKPYENIRSHLKKNELPFRVLVDHGNKVADLFDAKTTPHIYVFGKDGKLVYKGLVDDDQKDKNAEGRKNHLRDVLGKLAKDEKVEPFTTKEEGCTIKRVKAAAAPTPASAGENSGKKSGS